MRRLSIFLAAVLLASLIIRPVLAEEKRINVASQPRFIIYEVKTGSRSSGEETSITAVLLVDGDTGRVWRFFDYASFIALDRTLGDETKLGLKEKCGPVRLYGGACFFPIPFKYWGNTTFLSPPPIEQPWQYENLEKIFPKPSEK